MILKIVDEMDSFDPQITFRTTLDEKHADDANKSNIQYQSDSRYILLQPSMANLSASTEGSVKTQELSNNSTETIFNNMTNNASTTAAPFDEKKQASLNAAIKNLKTSHNQRLDQMKSTMKRLEDKVNALKDEKTTFRSKLNKKDQENMEIQAKLNKFSRQLDDRIKKMSNDYEQKIKEIRNVHQQELKRLNYRMQILKRR